MSAPEPITYTLRFPAPETHYVEVEARRPDRRAAADRADDGGLDARLVPGARVRPATSRRSRRPGRTAPPLAVDQDAEEPLAGRDRRARARVIVRYRVYGREMSVRTNWVEARFALLNGAPTFLTLRRARAPRPHEVALVLPAAWKTSVTALPAVAGRRPHHYRAADYDDAGRFADLRRQPGGPPRSRSTASRTSSSTRAKRGVFDGPRSAARRRAKIVARPSASGAVLPYDALRVLQPAHREPAAASSTRTRPC